MRRFVVSALVFLALAGCGKFERDFSDNGIIFRATIENDIAKTTVNTDSSSIENRGKVAWEEGDEIVVYSSDKSVSIRYEASEISSDGSAVFRRILSQEGDLGEGPYTATFGDTISTHQVYGSVVRDLPMTGTSDSYDRTRLNFSVSCALLRVILKNDATFIRRLELGRYALECPTPQDISSFKEFFFVLPEGNYREFIFVDTLGHASRKYSDGGIDISAGKISSIRFSSLPSFDLLPGKFTVGEDKVRFSKSNYGTILTFSEANSLDGGGRLLTNDEWSYLIENSSNRNDVEVDGIMHCLVLAPDAFAGTIDSTYTSDEWKEAELKGLVYLTPDGYRNKYSLKECGDNGYYWSSDIYTTASKGYCLKFGSGIEPSSWNLDKGWKASVRLVYDVR